MKITRFKIVPALFVGLVSIPITATGQWRGPMGLTYNTPMSSLAATMVLNKAREDDLARRLGRGTSSGSRTAPASRAMARENNRATIDNKLFRFEPSPASSKLKKLADDLGSSQAERDQYFELMKAVITAFDERAAKAGVPNDVALALAFFIGENLRIYHGGIDPPDSQYLALRETIAQALGSADALRQATNAQKQEMYETLVAYTGLTELGYEAMLKNGNQEMAQGFRKVAGQSFQTVTKMSPDTVNFGADGLTFGDN